MSNDFEDRSLEDEEFDAYLRRDTEVSQRYRDIGGREIPPMMDQKVLERARQQTARLRRRPWLRWGAPLAFAATALITLSVLQPALRDPEAPMVAKTPGAAEPAPATPAAAPAAEPSAVESDGALSDAASNDQRLQLAEKPARVSGNKAASDEASRRDEASVRKDSAVRELASAAAPPPPSPGMLPEPRSNAALPAPAPAPVQQQPPVAATAAKAEPRLEQQREREAPVAAGPSGSSSAVLGGAQRTNDSVVQPADAEKQRAAKLEDDAPREAAQRAAEEKEKTQSVESAAYAFRGDSLARRLSREPPPEPARAGESTLERDRTFLPGQWVNWIRRFRNEGNDARAEELLERLQAAHPDFKIPAELATPASPPK